MCGEKVCVPLAGVLAFLFLTGFRAIASQAQVSVTRTVDGQSGPWDWVGGGLNTSFEYGTNDQLSPLVVSAADGFTFSAGATLDVNYLSGTVSAEVGVFPFTDANGDVNFQANDNNSNGYFPSLYMSHSQYPVNQTELVGTFADNSGAIVGLPFNVGNSAVLTIPSGATRLQLGANDTVFSDNSGSWQIQISGSGQAPTPPPPPPPQISVNRTVDGHAGPWQWTVGGLNSNYQYGINDQSAPTVISAKDGFDFTAGRVLNISYLSGLVSAEAGVFPFTDAKGYTSFPANKTSDPTTGFFPSLYINSSQYPANLTELVGTFADSNGQIVGAPFNVGDLAALTIPAGAMQLQLGTNDTYYSDNSGSWQIQVTEAVLPEPSLIFVAVVCVAGMLMGRRGIRSSK
jgi:hypothetical protein